MSWRISRLIWQLSSPLHIGTTPAGSLNRTRLYIPARTMWAAFTNEIARRCAQEGFPDYEKIGEELKTNLRFTYFYPAIKVEDASESFLFYPWLPCYQDDGMKWKNEYQNQLKSDRELRRELLWTQPGTAIDPNCDSAQEQSLREFEYIMPFWRSESERQPVYFVGYVFIKSACCCLEAVNDLLRNKTIIVVGGESKYGFGRLIFIDKKDCQDVFGLNIRNNKDCLINVPQGKGILAHAPVGREQGVMKGHRELLVMWDRGRLLKFNSLYWTPGSRVQHEQIKCVIEPDGFWKIR